MCNKGLFVFLFLMIGVSVYAGEREITLRECIDTALQNHPNLLVSIEEKKQAWADYKAIRGANNLLVAGELKTVERLKDGVSSTSFSIPGVDTNFGLFGGLTATYPLFNMQKSQAEDSSRLSIDLSKFKAKKTEFEVMYDVKKAYYQYIISRENVKLRNKTLHNSKKKQKQAKILFENGTKTILDVTSADVEIGEANLAYEKARNNERLMKAQLYSSMGIKSDDDINISLSPLEDLPQLKYSLTDLYKLSDLYSPEIMIVKLQKKISKMNIEVQDWGHYPTVDLALALGIENQKLFNTDSNDSFWERAKSSNWTPTYNMGITIKVPVYYGGAISAKVESAVSDYNKMVYYERKVVVQMNDLIKNQYKSLEEFSRQFTISKLMLANARKHQLLAQRSYENGIGSQLTLQNAEMTVLSAELAYIKLKVEYLLTLADVCKIVGLREEYLCKK
ncbi:MAG: TolC family protein [bacterium]|nr:TolC family protein [bacterium]